ncbi:PLP-dependent transferase [Sulfidibacter corallicola]|uniref:PLP-dependent transferase n=1 Tax=Sulfidibacter corallicola TaxID=2818388 RepID=A0A8A4THR0_SULCO|nr:PLP-dependent transferase [Sulfidibacter corallicola]QTD49466.1 PLP-dependent transferase [Sulfidibacter corallicola]
MRDLISSPKWQGHQLGLPLPDGGHAVSVSMPHWRHVVGYEEGAEDIVNALQCGYPRFVIHPFVVALNKHLQAALARPGEACFAFPSLAVAQRAKAFLHRRSGLESRIATTPFDSVFALCFPESGFETAKSFWQHTGEIVSSRQAQSVMDRERSETGEGAEAKTAIRAMLAELSGIPSDCIWLFPTGMAAIAAIHRVCGELIPGRPSVQLGFPYVDTLKVQEKLGNGAVFLPHGHGADLKRLNALVQDGEVSAVYCECPTNPLLQTPDLAKIAHMTRPAGVPLIVDNTLDSFANINPFPHADVAVISLTKYFSGVGNVMGGALLLNPQSERFDALCTGLAATFEDLLWSEDAIVLAENGRDFRARLTRVNRTAGELCRYLKTHPAVTRVHYPEFVSRANYESLSMSSDPGFGGLFSLELVDGPSEAPRVYDALRVCKGPGLGTNFTLACPYTLLAHYGERDWAASCGVRPDLLRVSVGLEDADDLMRRFEDALAPAPIRG